jgi:hypothetical protein
MDFESEPSRGRKRQREEDISDIAPDQEQNPKQIEQPQQSQEDGIPTQRSLSGSNRRLRGDEGGEQKNSIQSSVECFPFGLSSGNQSRPQMTRPSISMRRSRIDPQSRGCYDLTALETATPSVRQSYGSSSDSAPEAVDRLVKSLAQDAECAIPSSMRGFFEEHCPRLAQQTPESAFTTDEQLYSWGADSAVWKRVRTIRDRAEKCSRKHMDEQACIAIVRLVLDLALDLADSPDTDFALEINDVRSQSLSRSFLPRSRDHQYTDRKTDLVIAVDMDKGIHVKANPSLIPFSPMTDAYTEKVPLLCGIEVKDLGGNEEDSQLQLMIWQAAMLTHLNYLYGPRCKDDPSLPPDIPLPPVVGWTIQQDKWRFYVAWREPNGDIRVREPFVASVPASYTGTGDTVCMFVLLKILLKLILWFKQDYYPTYKALLQRAVDTDAKAAKPAGVRGLPDDTVDTSRS